MRMSPWSFADLLRDDIDAWVSRMKEAARGRGQTMVGSIFRSQLAARAGVTTKQLDRYCSGESMPPPDRLQVLCAVIGSARAVKHLAVECGLGVYDRVPAEAATFEDHVRGVASVLRETGEAATAALDADHDRNGHISIVEYRAVEKELLEAIDALQRLTGLLRTRMEEALRR
jgi:hypothetical protein